MHWKIKALTQNILSNVPGGGHAYSFLQRRVLRTLPPSDENFLDSVAQADRHLSIIQDYLSVPLSQASFYEFGAGASLVTPMTFFTRGVSKQTLTDVYAAAKPWILQHTVQQFYRLTRDGLAHRLPVLPLSAIGIEYRAPQQPVQETDHQYDVITSTSVLEHIPSNNLPALFRGLRSMLKPTGLMLHHIDHSDHFGIGSKAITRYNFLQYSDRQWQQFNSSFHYQNRLRHSDYIRLMKDAGFEIVWCQTDVAEERDLNALKTLAIDSKFQAYSQDELAILHTLVVARPIKG